VAWGGGGKKTGLHHPEGKRKTIHTADTMCGEKKGKVKRGSRGGKKKCNAKKTKVL